MSTQQDSNSSDEIDLRELFKFTSKGIENLFNRIINLLVSIRRITIQNFKLFISVTVLTLTIVSAYHFQFRKEVFGSSMLVSSIYLNGKLVENTVTKLNSLAEEDDTFTLSKVLDVDEKVAKQITGFEFEPFAGENEKLEIELLKEKLITLKIEEATINSIYEKISIRNPNTFRITALTETNNIIYALDTAIVKYFLQNPFIKKRIKVNRETLIKRKSKLESEQLKIDSLRKTIFDVYQSLAKDEGSKGSDNIILGGRQQVANPLDVFKTDLKINEDLLAIDRQLFLKNEFEVIEGLTPFSKPVNISFLHLVAYAIISSIVFSYTLLILIGLNRFFIEREEQLN
jgi:hypothetical protein